jgi:glycosyltransferase involved in cell wall biosynthesis
MMIGTLGPGGAERQLVLTASALNRRNSAAVSVACVHLSGPANSFFKPELEAAGVEVAQIGSEGDGAVPASLRALIATLPAELREIGAFAATIYAHRPRIAHLWLDEINVKGGLAAVLAGVPRIVISQRSLPPTNFAFHRPYMREAYRWLAKRPNVKMVNNSEAGARAYEAWLGLPHGTIDVLRNGYAFSDAKIAAHRAALGRYREITGIPASVPVLGSIMRLSEEKRPFFWLDIAAHVRAAMPEVHFLIVGDGPIREALEKRANEPDLVGCVHFTGHLKDALDALVDMDMLLLVSRAEGLPNVLIEAQLLGVPVVATPVGGAIEALDRGRSGWLLESEDALTCATRIVGLLRDEKWRKAASGHGPEFVKARFGLQRAVDETLALYGEPLDR